MPQAFIHAASRPFSKTQRRLVLRSANRLLTLCSGEMRRRCGVIVAAFDVD
jgi:hypothetical protein